MNKQNKTAPVGKTIGRYITGFSGVHPPGGLVSWPNGTTTRIGQYRVNNTGSRQKTVVRKAFIAWPKTAPQPLRA